MALKPNNREFKEEVEHFLPQYNGDHRNAALVVHAVYRSLGIDTGSRLADYVNKYHNDFTKEEMNRQDEYIKLHPELDV